MRSPKTSRSILPKGNLLSMLFFSFFSTNPGMVILKNNYFSFRKAAKFLILGDLGIPAGTNTGISTCSLARPRLKLKNLGMLRIISYNISIYFEVRLEKINIFIFLISHYVFYIHSLANIFLYLLRKGAPSSYINIHKGRFVAKYPHRMIRALA